MLKELQNKQADLLRIHSPSLKTIYVQKELEVTNIVSIFIKSSWDNQLSLRPVRSAFISGRMSEMITENGSVKFQEKVGN